MTGLAWGVLLLVFLDEVLAVIALGYGGWHQDPAWLWVWLVPLVAVLIWYWFASPKARFGHPVGRPVAKVLVFGLAGLALWDAGHPTLAAVFLVFSVVVNVVALLPAIASMADQLDERS